MFIFSCLGLPCLSFLCSCNKNEGKNDGVFLELSSDSITVDSGAGRQTVELTSNTEWEIDNPSSEWISISPSRGQADTVTLTVEVSSNESYDMREHTFNIVAGTETVSLTVSQRQLGYLDFRLASKGGNIFLDEGGICEVLATTSIEYEIEYTDNGAEWVSLQQTKALEEETLLFLIAEYTGDSQRECDIVFKEVGGDSKDTIHIVQYHDTEVEFEDAEFERYCLERFDEDGDGRIIGREVRNIREINISELGITSLSGIEAFENIEFIDCCSNDLTSLDVSNCVTLDTLFCNDNKLTSIDVSGCTSLQYLLCDNNELTSLDVSGCSSLQLFSCTNNRLTNINLSDCIGLQIFWCDNNQLTNLDISECVNLRILQFHYNQLSAIDPSGCPVLESIGFIGNRFSSLDLSDCPGLRYLCCDNNQLTELDLSVCPGLQDLWCNNNELTSLDVSFCPDLSWFECSENPLQSMTILREQGNRSWMSEIVNEYPDIEIILK